MDQAKIGQLIRERRTALGLTQQALAERLMVSDKAVSKWERAQGCPDVSLLPALARELEIALDSLMAGNLAPNENNGGTMKNLKFYVCPDCGNVITASNDTAVSCCGRPLTALEPKKAEKKLEVELIENEWYVTSDHEMTKEHYIAFVALLTGDTLILRRQYPEWDLSTRIPRIGHGKLLWYCAQSGLQYQLI